MYAPNIYPHPLNPELAIGTESWYENDVIWLGHLRVLQYLFSTE